MIGWYDWPGGREAFLRFGPADGPMVVAAPALFEEGNRTRAFLVRILRLLGERGIASVLPDLPGQGESLVPTEQARLCDWRTAFRVAAGTGAVGTLAIRGGALVDGAPLPHWRLAPLTGPELTRELDRVRLTAGRADPAADPVEIAGNPLSRALLADLAAATPDDAPQVRVIRLEGDPRPADRVVAGPPLWRRSEPASDEALAAALAADIADWVYECAA